MRMNKYTESDKCENKADKSASLILTLSHEGQGNGGRKQIWGSKKAMLLSVVGACLSVTLLSASEAHAETCTASPDCKSLGYTESSCSDGGVKCPFGNYWFCGAKKVSCEVKNCQVGDVLYGDKKCYTCLANTLSGQVPIGVVFASRKAVGLVDLSTGAYWSSAKSMCSSYSIGGISGWYLPSKDELLLMYGNINAIQTGLQSAIGGSKLTSAYYWSSSVYYNFDNYSWIVNPVSGDSIYYYQINNLGVRPVLAF